MNDYQKNIKCFLDIVKRLRGKCTPRAEKFYFKSEYLA